MSPPGRPKGEYPERAARRYSSEPEGMAALIVGASPCRLWGLDAHERLRRQLREVGVRAIATDPADLGDARQVLVVDAGFLFGLLTLRGVLAHPDALLVRPDDGRVAAASVAREHLDAVVACVRDGAARPPALRVLTALDLAGYDRNLRKTAPPLLEAVTPDKRAALEALLYGNAYKGVTDFVTKWWWPRPARVLVGWCARLGITPNSVTLLGVLLMLAATYAFYQGAYAVGLACGWVMTLLDTVDGKLARVTVASSRFGHFLDHGVDVVHPPFWYVAWGLGLGALEAMDPLLWTLGLGPRARHGAARGDVGRDPVLARRRRLRCGSPDRGRVPPARALRHLRVASVRRLVQADHRAAQSLPRHPDPRHRRGATRRRVRRRGRLDACEQRHSVLAAALCGRRPLAVGPAARFLAQGRHERGAGACARLADLFGHPRRLSLMAARRPADAAVLAATLALAVAAPAHAFEFNFADGEVNGYLDTTLSFGSLWRMQGRNPGLIAIANGGTSRNPNADDGNLNYDKGDLVSLALNATVDFSLKYRDFGMFARGTYFYDKALQRQGRAR